MKVCSTPGCPELCDEGKCHACRRKADQARGTRQQRGYDAEHTHTRDELLPLAYGTRCQHCGERMWPHQALALDHTEDRSGYRGIVHASCNASEGASRGNRLR